MNKRVKELRSTLGLTLEKFGEKLGVGKNAISRIETAKSNLTDQMLKAICNVNWDGKYVNEEWLRTGEGEMFNPDPSSEVDALVNKYNLSNEGKILIENFVNLKPEYQEAVIQFIIQVADSLKVNDTKPEKNLEELSDEEQIELYRQELKFEREVTEKSEVLPKSG